MHDGQAGTADGFAYRMLYLPQLKNANLCAFKSDWACKIPFYMSNMTLYDLCG